MGLFDSFCNIFGSVIFDVTAKELGTIHVCECMCVVQYEFPNKLFVGTNNLPNNSFTSTKLHNDWTHRGNDIFQIWVSIWLFVRCCSTRFSCCFTDRYLLRFVAHSHWTGCTLNEPNCADVLNSFLQKFTSPFCECLRMRISSLCWGGICRSWHIRCRHTYSTNIQYLWFISCECWLRKSTNNGSNANLQHIRSSFQIPAAYLSFHSST